MNQKLAGDEPATTGVCNCGSNRTLLVAAKHTTKYGPDPLFDPVLSLANEVLI